MTGKGTDNQAMVPDSSSHVLELLQRLLCRTPAEQDSLPVLLTQIGEGFAAQAAGLAALPECAVAQRCTCGSQEHAPPARWPWNTDPGLVSRVQQARTAVTVLLPERGSLLLTCVAVPGVPGWLLWLEDERRSGWTVGEAAALTLAGQVLARFLASGDVSARWVEQLNRAVRQQQLEAVASMARRLAHDFGNIFTGILGFTELSLAHPSPGAALVHSYLNEVYCSAQTGARRTQQLRLFSRRQCANPNLSSLAVVLEEVKHRVADKPELRDRLQFQVPAELPPLAIDREHLGHVLDALVENALEATTGQGLVSVSARPVQLGEECADYFGDLRPGPHVAIAVADSGSGLTADARQRVVVEPLFTTKPRHRGMGLAVAYGVLHAHRGGLRLRPGDEGGTVAEILVPVERPALDLSAEQNVRAPGRTGGEKVLVVDDDPMILNFVRTTLERAGYRVQAVTNGEEALTSFSSAHPEPFRLVLSDVVMPRLNGIDLARQLLQRDANVCLLLMSGHPTNELSQRDLANDQFEFLAKPFRPEGLLRAVRTAIERRPAWTKSGGAGTAEEELLKSATR